MKKMILNLLATVLAVTVGAETLQEVIDAAVDGATIEWSGETGPIEVRGRSLTIIGTNAVIRSGGGSRCAYLGAEGSTAVVLKNFTLKGGSADWGGGAYGGRLVNCRIIDCSASIGGGAYGSTLEGCVIQGNSANASGAALANCTATGCTISGNRHDRSNGAAPILGGVISDSTLMDCSLTDNRVEFGNSAPVIGAVGYRVRMTGGSCYGNEVSDSGDRTILYADEPTGLFIESTLTDVNDGPQVDPPSPVDPPTPVDPVDPVNPPTPVEEEIDLDDLPAWAIGTFDGYIAEGAAAMGAATLKITKSGKVSGSYKVGGTKWTVKGQLALADGKLVIVAEAKAGKMIRPLRLNLQPDASSAGLDCATISCETEDLTLQLGRNIWKDKSAKALAKSLVGCYTAALSTPEGTLVGYLLLNVNSSGKAKASGKLPGGVSATGSVQLNYQDGALSAFWLATPSAYKKGYACALLKIAGGRVTGTGEWRDLSPAAQAVVGDRSQGALVVDGAFYDKGWMLSLEHPTLTFAASVPQLDYVCKFTTEEGGRRKTTKEDLKCDAAVPNYAIGLSVANNKIIVPSVNKPVRAEDGSWSYAGANLAALKVSLKAASGAIKGSFVGWYDYATAIDLLSGKTTWKHTSKKVSFEGVWIQGAGLIGFYIWNQTADYVDNGRVKTLKYKVLLPVEFR